MLFWSFSAEVGNHYCLQSGHLSSSMEKNGGGEGEVLDILWNMHNCALSGQHFPNFFLLSFHLCCTKSPRYHNSNFNVVLAAVLQPSWSQMVWGPPRVWGLMSLHWLRIYLEGMYGALQSFPPRWLELSSFFSDVVRCCFQAFWLDHSYLSHI